MLNGDKIIAIYCFVDDLLKGIDHKEPRGRKMSDSELLTTAIISAVNSCDVDPPFLHVDPALNGSIKVRA
jgi:hypothetical protein